MAAILPEGDFNSIGMEIQGGWKTGVNAIGQTESQSEDIPRASRLVREMLRISGQVILADLRA